MPADKMPKMPEPVYDLVGTGFVYTAAQMRAMYVAGIEAARQAVPLAWAGDTAADRAANRCRETTLANLDALTKETP